MSNVTYCSNLYCAPMWFDCTITVLIASKMLVNLNIKSFGELLRVFVHGFRSRTIISRNFCCQVFVIVHVVFIQSYGLGDEHYCMFICDRPHSYYSLRNS